MKTGMRKTKIVATISSRNCAPELLRSLYEAGMDVARINTAHLSTEEAEQVVSNIRTVSDRIAILIDTKGPEVRTGDFPEPRTIADGDELTFGAQGSAVDIPVNYRHFVREVPVGARLLIDDGAVELVVVEKSTEILRCRAIGGGVIEAHKSLNTPGVKLKLPAVSSRDRGFIELAIRLNLDFIAHSFVRGRDDVMAVQSILDTAESGIQIIAKIENRSGVDHLSEILDTAAGVMVARGDLGVEIPLEQVPEIQKKMIYECMRRRKVVITATQMLQSMQDSPRPTRAEVSDVANAVLDGTDAVMLSGETANGKYPLEAVRMMARTVIAAEHIPAVHATRAQEIDFSDDPVRGFMARGALQSTQDLGAGAIICYSSRGTTARLCSAYRPSAPILALSHDPQTMRQLALSYGVRPFLSAWCEGFDDLIHGAIDAMLQDGELKHDTMIALMVPYPASARGSNVLGLMRAGDIRPEKGKRS